VCETLQYLIVEMRSNHMASCYHDIIQEKKSALADASYKIEWGQCGIHYKH
jgi:hypothetical protein